MRVKAGFLAHHGCAKSLDEGQAFGDINIEIGLNDGGWGSGHLAFTRFNCHKASILVGGTARNQPPQAVSIKDVITHAQSGGDTIVNVGQGVVPVLYLERTHEPMLIETNVVKPAHPLIIGVLDPFDFAIVAQVIQLENGGWGSPNQLSAGAKVCLFGVTRLIIRVDAELAGPEINL